MGEDFLVGDCSTRANVFLRGLHHRLKPRIFFDLPEPVFRDAEVVNGGVHYRIDSPWVIGC
jgi:hypothetical protein